MLQQDKAEDYVVATGLQYSVREFVEIAASEIGLEISWQGAGVNEKGYDRQGHCVIQVDPKYFRPTEVETLLGDASKAKRKLGWVPRISFSELVKEMMQEDIKAAERDQLMRRHGHKVMDYHE